MRCTRQTGVRPIAILASTSGEPQAPIQVGAQVLRRRQAQADAGILGFVMPGDTPTGDDAPRWREADVERAIAAAARAGLAAYRIEIAPDGTIAIVVGSSDAA